jgi:probable HAF family extracellular repeat protein
MSTTAYGINAAGTVIVGAYDDASGTTHGFVWP